MHNKQSVLWMGELDNYMTEEYIVKAFEQAGEKVIDVRVIRNKQTGLPAGYCFVDFGDGAKIESIMRRHNGNPIPSSDPLRFFKLNYASGNAPEFSLYVGDLSSEVNDIMLLDFFQQRFPSCRAARVVQEANGKSKGYGFVRFTEEQEQQRALREMENIPGLGSRTIKVRIAVPKKGGSSPPGSGNHSPLGAGSSPAPAPLLQYYYPSQTPYYHLSGHAPTPTWVDPYSGAAPYMHQPYYYQSVPYQMTGALPPDARYAGPCDTYTFDPRTPLDMNMRNFEYLRSEERQFFERDGTQWGFISPTIPQIS
ncbi:tRNA selenocysteine 1-associated protein 1 isoform X2 [Oopsacas minuta]|uniref:tRNA selenocysteine-associated protein 1 n=1 Tax=Oopsacas minuta TaxID=111878 RepID=A0AAV7JCM2_9METZ|nr:tRNA selenocysteine 1-associated protein 1 isoform X2 [Oopsacas minuta]